MLQHDLFPKPVAAPRALKCLKVRSLGRAFSSVSESQTILRLPNGKYRNKKSMPGDVEVAAPGGSGLPLPSGVGVGAGGICYSDDAYRF